MKKLIAIGLILTGLLSACSDEKTVQEIQPDTGNRFTGIDGDVSIITDSKTGCKYIYVDSRMGTSHAIALSPLMKSNGTADCGN